MAYAALTEEALAEMVKAYMDCGRSIRAAAKQLGIPRQTAQHRIRVAARRGFLGTDPVLPGFRITQTTTTLDAAGNPTRKSVQQRPEGGGPFELPDGHVVTGISTFLDESGNKRGEWVKTRRHELTPEETARRIEAVFENFKPLAAPVVVPDTDPDKLIVYPLADWHLGMFAWGAETDGKDWDLSIGRKAIVTAFNELAEMTPSSEAAWLLGLGDLMHVDNNKSATPTSNHYLDSDTRFAKILDATTETVLECVEIARRKHRRLRVVLKPGNHDETAIVGIRQGVRMYYRETANIDVDQSPSPFFCDRFGVNQIGGVHGDKAKPNQLPLLMATTWKADWSSAKVHEWHTGHVHHDVLHEIDGVRVWQHRAPIPRDFYHSAAGYLSGRSMKSFLYHVERGSRGHSEIDIS